MSTSPTFEPRQAQRPITIHDVLAGIRNVESGSYRGNYSLSGPRFQGRSYYGAYQIGTENWSQWAALAGIPGADMRSQQAQDQVAGYIVSEYYARYKDWDLAAMAWFAGSQEAAKVLRRGYDGIESIQNPKIRQYVTDVRDRAIEAHENPEIAYTDRTANLRFAEARPGSGWVNPVAGKSEYSNSFRVKRTNNTSGIHGAIDVYADKGTPIVAPVAGKVLSTKQSKVGGYTARILGDDGVVYYFAHMDGAAVVGAGQRVQAGHHVGYVGNSGNARGTTPHLHLKMSRGGAMVNPYSYLQQSSTVGLAASTRSDDADVLAMPQQSGMAGTMSSWLQNMSNEMRSSALETVEPVEEESPSGMEPV